MAIRKVIYTTNGIEPVNHFITKGNQDQGGVFPRRVDLQAHIFGDEQHIRAVKSPHLRIGG